MDTYTATALAYNNGYEQGYEQGKKDAVKHGRWEFNESDFADIWKCSACGNEWCFEYDPREADTEVNYCPSCGSRMNGGNEDG